MIRFIVSMDDPYYHKKYFFEDRRSLKKFIKHNRWNINAIYTVKNETERYLDFGETEKRYRVVVLGLKDDVNGCRYVNEQLTYNIIAKDVEEARNSALRYASMKDDYEFLGGEALDVASIELNPLPQDDLVFGEGDDD